MRGPSAPRPDPEVRQPLALLPGWPPSCKDFKVLSGVCSRHVWFCQAGRKPSSHCLSVRPQAWGHLVLLKVTGQQLKRLANRAGTVAASSLLQPRDRVTAGPAGLEDHCCPSVFVRGGENWPLHLQKPDQAKALGGVGRTPAVLRGPLGVRLCGLLHPWVVCRARLGRSALFVVGSRHATLSRGGPQTGVSPARLAWGGGWHLLQCLLGAQSWRWDTHCIISLPHAWVPSC